MTRTTSQLSRLDAIGPHIDVPLLPAVGRTWVNRSGSYWRRRMGVSLLWLFMLAVITVITVAILLAYWHRTLGGFIGVLTFLAAYTVAVVVLDVGRHRPSLERRACLADRESPVHVAQREAETGGCLLSGWPS